MKTRYIRAGIVSALIGVVAILLVISVQSSDTSQTKAIASNLEKVSPAPDGLQRPQSEISVDLQDGYIGRLIIDGKVIPDDEVEKVIALGQYTFLPGKGKMIEMFEAGPHTAQILYWEADKPEPSTPENYTWSFRVTS